MQLLAHITEEASRRLNMIMFVVLIAVVTVAAFVIWGIAFLAASWIRRGEDRDKSDEDP